MPRKRDVTTKHEITPDLILDLYKHTKVMDDPERGKTVDKIKKLVKYMGRKIAVDLNDIKN
jgi:hypothetical protein